MHPRSPFFLIFFNISKYMYKLILAQNIILYLANYNILLKKGYN